MLYASCKNCVHAVGAGRCELKLRPDDGEMLCKKYAMSTNFRERVLDLVREDIAQEINRAVLEVRVRQAEHDQAFAG